jgi:hypothetical protein
LQLVLPGPLQEFVEAGYSSGSVRSLGVYTLLTNDITRNSGPFWEPGAFQGFINICLVLLPMRQWRQKRFRVAVLFVALLSTLSTTGYITFFILFALKIAFEKREGSRIIASAVGLFVIVLGILAYQNLDFLGKKIADELEFTVENKGSFNPSRSGAFLFDLPYIEKHPFIGNGFAAETRFSDNPELWASPIGHGNGFSGFLAAMGVLGLLGYYVALFRSPIAAHLGDRVILAVILTLLLQGEHFLLLSFFLGLPFASRAAEA